VQGVSLVRSQLLEIFGRFGITPIDAAYQPFDPNLHEGVMQEPRKDVPPGTVVKVLEPGYRLHERVLRPAKVVLATPQANGC
jgi:molecular chaperone GrpE